MSSIEQAERLIAAFFGGDVSVEPQLNELKPPILENAHELIKSSISDQLLFFVLTVVEEQTQKPTLYQLMSCDFRVNLRESLMGLVPNLMTKPQFICGKVAKVVALIAKCEGESGVSQFFSDSYGLIQSGAVEKVMIGFQMIKEGFEQFKEVPPTTVSSLADIIIMGVESNDQSIFSISLQVIKSILAFKFTDISALEAVGPKLLQVVLKVCDNPEYLNQASLHECLQELFRCRFPPSLEPVLLAYVDKITEMFNIFGNFSEDVKNCFTGAVCELAENCLLNAKPGGNDLKQWLEVFLQFTVAQESQTSATRCVSAWRNLMESLGEDKCSDALLKDLFQNLIINCMQKQLFRYNADVLEMLDDNEKGFDETRLNNDSTGFSSELAEWTSNWHLLFGDILENCREFGALVLPSLWSELEKVNSAIEGQISADEWLNTTNGSVESVVHDLASLIQMVDSTLMVLCQNAFENDDCEAKVLFPQLHQQFQVLLMNVLNRCLEPGFAENGPSYQRLCIISMQTCLQQAMSLRLACSLTKQDPCEIVSNIAEVVIRGLTTSPPLATALSMKCVSVVSGISQQYPLQSIQPIMQLIEKIHEVLGFLPEITQKKLFAVMARLSSKESSIPDSILQSIFQPILSILSEQLTNVDGLKKAIVFVDETCNIMKRQRKDSKDRIFQVLFECATYGINLFNHYKGNHGLFKEIISMFNGLIGCFPRQLGQDKMTELISQVLEGLSTEGLLDSSISATLGLISTVFAVAGRTGANLVLISSEALVNRFWNLVGSANEPMEILPDYFSAIEALLKNNFEVFVKRDKPTALGFAASRTQSFKSAEAEIIFRALFAKLSEALRFSHLSPQSLRQMMEVVKMLLDRQGLAEFEAIQSDLIPELLETLLGRILSGELSLLSDLVIDCIFKLSNVNSESFYSYFLPTFIKENLNKEITFDSRPTDLHSFTQLIREMKQ
eukprot:TRINITY_DN2407_c0_g1_i3.p1 TRINITY_DN2407_c0_g1~~TRINITY_DN2407_c0_g1_i3.p1  ORF type:complete len:958 (+),score=247.34 TRINITY_DN2407_c0_g1_i3:52-2925(+)